MHDGSKYMHSGRYDNNGVSYHNVDLNNDRRSDCASGRSIFVCSRDFFLYLDFE
jgi:hypothetical protein